MGERLDTDSDVDVRSAAIGSLIVADEPATLDLASGVKVAVSSAGDASAENETWQLAVGLAVDTGSSEHPIGPPMFANVIDPDSAAPLRAAETVATTVTT
jgi:hypothetical protein